MKWLESTFESMLWQSRVVVLFAVIASLLSAFAMFWDTTFRRCACAISPVADTERDLRRSLMINHPRPRLVRRMFMELR